MALRIAAVDAGNGGTDAVVYLGNKVSTVYFPSVRAAVSGDTLGLGDQYEVNYEWVDWRGHRYIIGDDVIDISRKALERHHGRYRYGDEFHQFLVAVALAQAGVKDGDEVDLTMFCPPGLYSERSFWIKRHFLDNNEVVIRLKSDNEARRFTYTNVTIWPEGLGAAACFALNKSGKPIKSDVLAGEVLLLDMGVHTLDALKLVNGNFLPENLEYATWENGGLQIHVLEPIASRVQRISDDFSIITTDDIDRSIRDGLETGVYTVSSAGQTVDISHLIDKYVPRYADWIANNIIDGPFNGLRGIKSAILFGGGAFLTHKRLANIYDDKIIDTRTLDETADIEPVFLNAVGGARLAKRAAKQGSRA